MKLKVNGIEREVETDWRKETLLDAVSYTHLTLPTKA